MLRKLLGRLHFHLWSASLVEGTEIIIKTRNNLPTKVKLGSAVHLETETWCIPDRFTLLPSVCDSSCYAGCSSRRRSYRPVSAGGERQISQAFL
jgi:hypothetical protein